MSKIKVKFFGPIKEGCLENDGWIDISKTTIFIGNQGSGKSTIAKLISTFTWIEKALVRGDHTKEWFEKENRFADKFLPYHRLENYLIQSDGLFHNTEIDYNGDAFQIKLIAKKLIIEKKENSNFPLPQIMYVPAERNFLSYVKSPKELRLSSDSLIEFLTEFDNAKQEIKDKLTLPINNAVVEYDEAKDVIHLMKGNSYKIGLTEASSGFQSLVPLYIVSYNLSKSVLKSKDKEDAMSTEEIKRFQKDVEEILSNDDLSQLQKRAAISTISSKFNKTSFINIVEEPEQNLFPNSQWSMLKSLLEFNNLSPSNKLIMTTHSPYIVNYISVAIQAEYLNNKIGTTDQSALDKLNTIVPLKSIVKAKEVSIYQLNEKDGTISKLKKYEGIPSDDNFLNNSLAEGNELFDSLLEIEQEL